MKLFQIVGILTFSGQITIGSSKHTIIPYIKLHVPIFIVVAAIVLTCRPQRQRVDGLSKIKISLLLRALNVLVRGGKNKNGDINI